MNESRKEEPNNFCCCFAVPDKLGYTMCWADRGNILQSQALENSKPTTLLPHLSNLSSLNDCCWLCRRIRRKHQKKKTTKKHFRKCMYRIQPTYQSYRDMSDYSTRRRTELCECLCDPFTKVPGGGTGPSSSIYSCTRAPPNVSCAAWWRSTHHPHPSLHPPPPLRVGGCRQCAWLGLDSLRFTSLNSSNFSLPA